MQYVLLCFIIQYCWTLCILNCNSDTYIKQRKLKFRQAYKWYLIIMKLLHIKTFIIFSVPIFSNLYTIWVWSLNPPECEVPAHLQRVILLPGGGQRLALGLLAGVVLHIVHVPHLGQGPGNVYCMSTIVIHNYVYYFSSYLCTLFWCLIMYDVGSRYVR